MIAPGGKLLSTTEVADILQVSPDWVLNHANGRGVLLPSLKVGKFRRFRQSDVDAFIVQCEALAADAIARKARLRRAA